MTPSPQQLAALDRFRLGGSFALAACAGSGKTSTIALLAAECPRNETAVALAFNRSAAESFQTKLPYWVQSSTFHSFWKRAIDASWTPRPKVSADKLKWLAKDHLELSRDSFFPTLALTGLLKQHIGEVDPVAVADHYGVDYDDEVLEAAVALLALSDADRSRMDFDDMLRFALEDSVRCTPAHTIFVDEAQDTNSVQLSLLRKMLRLGGRLVIVGDPHQAIYGFRGADANAFDALTTAFSADVLPLSVSWRCSQAVVVEARRVLGLESQQS
jgi:DNA helicase-2/ATP-dependent DNA helicase PcrA